MKRLWDWITDIIACLSLFATGWLLLVIGYALGG